MNEVVWQERAVHHHQQVHPHHQTHHSVMLANGQLPQSSEMTHKNPHTNNLNHNQNSVRSQDDAMVGYFFQRPNDPDFQNYAKQARWALVDDTNIEGRQNDTSELENDFQALALETDGFASTKKIWGMEENSATHKNDDDKGIFLAETQWGRDSTWSTGHDNASNHAVSQPIMVNSRRSGSYPGSDGPSMLSPRSNDTGGLGVKICEYVLESSPTSKDLEGRMSSRIHGLNDKHKKLKARYEDAKMHKDENSAIQTNGIMQNGLDDDGKGFNRTPGSHQLDDDDLSKNHPLNDLVKLKPNDGVIPTGILPGHGAPHFTETFEQMGIDPLQFSNEYGSHMINPIDSPGILDYNSPMYQQRPGQAQGQLSALIASQPQYNLAQQTQAMPHPNSAMGGTGNGGNPFSQNPYYPQDPFSAPIGHIIPTGPPPMMAQYYGLPAWGMYPGMIQSGQVQSQPGGPPPHVQQQQPMMRTNNGARPLTPSGANDNSGTPQTMQPGQYQMLPHGYFDQNGSIMMSNTTARGMNPAAMRLMPMIMNPNQTANNNIRMMPGNGQVNQNGPSSLFSSNGSNAPNNALYTSSNNSIGYNANSSGINSFSNNTNGNQLNFNPNINRNAQVQGYGNSALGPIGASIASGMGLGNSSPRRESFDARRDGLGMFSSSLENQFSRHLGAKNGHFYGLGPGIAPSPGPIGLLPPSQSLTPPPSLDGSTGSLNLNHFGSRLMSAAPGDKFVLRNGGTLLGSSNSMYSTRGQLPRNSSLDKSSGRSRLLEDFRNNRFPNLQLRDLTDHIVEFSQDQHGSRFIQQKLERATPQEKQLVFNEILGSAYNLMTDVFGNYVIQKFFEFGTPEQKQALAQKVRGHVLQLALQMYGCRVIQKALESIPQDQQKDVVKELDGHILKCVKDQNGNHVVQKCIECVEPNALQFIINAFQGQVLSLSTHPYGCRVIQRILEHCTPEQTAPILEELHQNVESLVQDQYGNYVVQHVLEHGRPEDKSKIIGMVRGKVLQLSQHKFASNVVERCVTHASRPERAFLIEEVCSYIDSTHSALYTMMKDQYANYVVQKMIEVAENQQRKLLLQRIRPHMASLRKYTYGKHILAKLEKYMVKSNDMGSLGGSTNGTL